MPPDLDVHLVMDNYGTHKTPLIWAWLTKRPRFHVHFTPTYASWLNLIERWFAELTTKQLRRGVHRSVRALEAAIDEFIAAHNAGGRPGILTLRRTAAGRRAEPVSGRGHDERGTLSMRLLTPRIRRGVPVGQTPHTTRLIGVRVLEPF